MQTLENNQQWSTHSCSWDFNEDRFNGGLTETYCSGYLHLPHITQVFREETHCLWKYNIEGAVSASCGEIMAFLVRPTQE